MKKLTLSHNELLAFFTQNIHLLGEDEDVYVHYVKANTHTVDCVNPKTFEGENKLVEVLDSITLTLKPYDE